MKQPTEYQIENYIRNRDSLTGEEIRLIESALNTNEETRLLAEWFTQFYKGLAQHLSEGKNKADSQVPSSFHLKPLQAEKKNGRRSFVLAAQAGSSQQVNEIEQIRTFASKKYGTLIRVLNLRSKNLTKIDVISDEVENDDIVILSVPGTAHQLITEPGGKISIPSDEISGNEIKKWPSCKINLPVLKSKVGLNTSNRDGYIIAKAAEGVKSIEVHQRNDFVEIYPGQVQDETIPSLLVIAEADKLPTLWELIDGKALIPKDKFQNRDLSLFFYN